MPPVNVDQPPVWKFPDNPVCMPLTVPFRDFFWAYHEHHIGSMTGACRVKTCTMCSFIPLQKIRHVNFYLKEGHQKLFVHCQVGCDFSSPRFEWAAKIFFIKSLVINDRTLILLLFPSLAAEAMLNSSPVSVHVTVCVCSLQAEPFKH